MKAVGTTCAVLLLLGALWSVGFAAFDRLSRRVPRVPPEADAIVALTGGADRVETALRLLEEGRAPLLLISGVGRGTELSELGRRVNLPAEQMPHITLGREATTTVGNAAETASWARSHDVRRLIVVTAGYHMPRALIELGRALPGVELYPVTVQPPALRGILEMGTVRMLANEYDKFLAVRLGWKRTGLPPRGEAT